MNRLCELPIVCPPKTPRFRCISDRLRHFARRAVAADDRQPPGRGVRLELFLDNAVGIVMEAGEDDLQIHHFVERAAIRRPGLSSSR
jgi:hypothetical protein